MPRAETVVVCFFVLFGWLHGFAPFRQVVRCFRIFGYWGISGDLFFESR